MSTTVFLVIISTVQGSAPATQVIILGVLSGVRVLFWAIATRSQFIKQGRAKLKHFPLLVRVARIRHACFESPVHLQGGGLKNLHRKDQPWYLC